MEGLIILCCVSIAIYCGYIVFANGYATDKIYDCRVDISNMVSGTNYKMIEFTFYDCSPREVRYGLCLKEEEPTYSKDYANGLPSRKFLRNLQRVKRGSMTWEEFHRICNVRAERHKMKQLRRKTI